MNSNTAIDAKPPEKLVVPKPNGLKGSDSWKGGISRKKLGDDITDKIEYTITHANGSKTLRTTIVKNGKKTSSKDRKIAAPQNYKPVTLTVPVPDGLANGDGWKGTVSKKTVDGNVEIVYNYEIMHPDGGKTMRTVTSCNGKKTTVDESIEPTESPEAAIIIPPPEDLKPNDGWKGSAERSTIGSEVTTTYSYTIFHKGGSKTLRKVIIYPDKKRKTLNRTKSAPLNYKPPEKEKIIPPQNLPYGCGWKAQRKITRDNHDVETKITKYSVTGISNGESMNYEQTETIVGDICGDLSKIEITGGPSSNKS